MKRRRRLETEIPMDVVREEILTKLPAKSLMRFKCVSRLWSSLISSRYFSNRFHTVTSRQRPRLYMCLLDLTDYRNSVMLSLVPDTTSSSCFVVDHDLTIPRMGSYFMQYLPGFICYTFLGKPRIYNPATRQLVTLPAAAKSNIVPSPTNNVFVAYYFGHDHVSDQYKVICSTGVILRNLQDLQEIRSELRVLVLKPGRRASWKKAAPTSPADFRPHIPARGGVCIDGVIYYLGWTDSYNAVLVSFHIRSRDFKMIQVPRRDGDELPGRVKNVSLIECGGKVTIVDQTNLREKGRLAFWAVEDAGNINRWSVRTLVLQPCQLHFVNNKTKFDVRGTTQDGKVFLIPQDLLSPFHILCYDLQSNDMRNIEIKGVPDHWFTKDKLEVKVMLMDQSESLFNVMYTDQSESPT